MSLKKFRDQVIKRANGLCEYCKYPAKYASEPFCMEHVKPKSKGGEDTLENLALSCSSCNGHKYNKTEGIDSATGEKAPLFNPREEKWNENFVWNENATKMLGITPTGRATVETLKLNNSNLQNIRKLLFDIGEHPSKE
ncbi:MAG: HNH endonuclease [Okeania sp. SIO3C4]|nr:HNH endonuclease [Okeania sp. SIO3C4]